MLVSISRTINLRDAYIPKLDIKVEIFNKNSIYLREGGDIQYTALFNQNKKLC